MAGRIVPINKPSLDKRLPRHKRARNEGKDPVYLAWIHGLPCCVSGRRDRIEAHHPTVGRGRMARKADDSTAVPVNVEFHSDQYATGLHRGETKFWNAHGVDPTSLADDLYAAFKAGATFAHGAEIIDAHRALAIVRRSVGIRIFIEKTEIER